MVKSGAQQMREKYPTLLRAPSMFSWKERMGVHMAFHRGPVNRAIHFVGVTAGIWGFLVCLNLIPWQLAVPAEYLAKIPASLPFGVELPSVLDPSLLFVLAYTLGCMLCEPVLALFQLGVLLALRHLALAFVAAEPALFASSSAPILAAALTFHGKIAVALFAMIIVGLAIPVLIGHRLFEEKGLDDADLNIAEGLRNPLAFLFLVFFCYSEVLLELGYRPALAADILGLSSQLRGMLLETGIPMLSYRPSPRTHSTVALFFLTVLGAFLSLECSLEQHMGMILRRTDAAADSAAAAFRLVALKDAAEFYRVTAGVYAAVVVFVLFFLAVSALSRVLTCSCAAKRTDCLDDWRPPSCGARVWSLAIAAAAAGWIGFLAAYVYPRVRAFIASASSSGGNALAGAAALASYSELLQGRVLLATLCVLLMVLYVGYGGLPARLEVLPLTLAWALNLSDLLFDLPALAWGLSDVRSAARGVVNNTYHVEMFIHKYYVPAIVAACALLTFVRLARPRRSALDVLFLFTLLLGAPVFLLGVEPHEKQLVALFKDAAQKHSAGATFVAQTHAQLVHEHHMWIGGGHLFNAVAPLVGVLIQAAIGERLARREHYEATTANAFKKNN